MQAPSTNWLRQAASQEDRTKQFLKMLGCLAARADAQHDVGSSFARGKLQSMVNDSINTLGCGDDVLNENKVIETFLLNEGKQASVLKLPQTGLPFAEIQGKEGEISEAMLPTIRAAYPRRHPCLRAYAPPTRAATPACAHTRRRARDLGARDGGYENNYGSTFW